MGDYGIRVSKEGVDVKTGADKDMILTSKKSLLKGHLEGSGTVAVTSGVVKTITIPHNLGYIPMAQCYIRDDSVGTGHWYMTPMSAGGGAEYLDVYSKSDSNNIYIIIDWWRSSGGTLDYTYKYFIYLDKAKL